MFNSLFWGTSVTTTDTPVTSPQKTIEKIRTAYEELLTNYEKHYNIFIDANNGFWKDLNREVFEKDTVGNVLEQILLRKIPGDDTNLRRYAPVILGARRRLKSLVNTC